MAARFPLLSFLVFAFLVLSSSDSRAADWSQRWQQSSTEVWNLQQVGPFDEMAVWATNGTGVVFQDPAFSGFSAAGWTAYNESGNIGARALSSMPFTYIQFDMNYATQFGLADFLYMCAYQGEVRQRQRITYDSHTGWNYPAFTGTDAEWHALGGGDPIPEPSTILLFGPFLPLLFFKRKR